MKLIATYRLLFLGFITSLFLPSLLLADYTIVLKNGGRITVKDYRDEEGMIRFKGPWGSIGLSREQIQSIREARDGEARGLVVAAMKKSPLQAEASQETLAAKGVPAGITGVANDKATSRQTEKDLRSEKEKSYQDKYEALVEAIKSKTDLYWLLTRGTSDIDPTLLKTLEAIDGRINDINARIKDILYGPAREASPVRLLTNSPFSGQYGTTRLDPAGVVSPGFVDAQPFTAPTVGAAPPSYSVEEKGLSDLRRQLEMLYQERKKLIESFEQEKFFTGSLPYEALP